MVSEFVEKNYDMEINLEKLLQPFTTIRIKCEERKIGGHNTISLIFQISYISRSITLGCIPFPIKRLYMMQLQLSTPTNSYKTEHPESLVRTVQGITVI